MPAGSDLRLGWGDVLFGGAGLVVLAALWRADVIRPGSFRRRGTRAVPWPWWFFLLCLATVYFLQGLAVVIAAAVVGPPVGEGPDAAAADAVVQVVASAVGGLGGLVLLTVVARWTPGPASAHGLGFRPVGRAVLVGLGAIVLAMPVVALSGLIAQILYTLATGQPTHTLNHDTLRLLSDDPNSPAAWALAAAAVVGAPIVEELIFRVFLQTALLGATGRTWLAVLLTSFLFAGVHLGAGVQETEAYVLVPLFVLGAAMGIAYERSRNVLVPIVMHAAFNGINIALTLAMTA